jgi:hypothetical protein
MDNHPPILKLCAKIYEPEMATTLLFYLSYISPLFIEAAALLKIFPE